MTDAGRGSAGGDERDARAAGLERTLALRWLALLSPLVVPWVVIRTAETTLLFPWGTLVVESGQLTPIWAFLTETAIPEHVERWPLGAACYALALCWAATRRFGTDQRVTAGLFVLVAVVVASVSSGFGVDPNRTAIPLGSVHALGLAAGVYFRG